MYMYIYMQHCLLPIACCLMVSSTEFAAAVHEAWAEGSSRAAELRSEVLSTVLKLLENVLASRYE